MTLDEIILTVCTAVQPFVDSEKPNPREVQVVVTELKQLFTEEPQAREAFVAAVVAIVKAARKNWREMTSDEIALEAKWRRDNEVDRT
jgi:hypothetical protein